MQGSGGFKGSFCFLNRACVSWWLVLLTVTNPLTGETIFPLRCQIELRCEADKRGGKSPHGKATSSLLEFTVKISGIVGVRLVAEYYLTGASSRLGESTPVTVPIYTRNVRYDCMYVISQALPGSPS